MPLNVLGIIRIEHIADVYAKGMSGDSSIDVAIEKISHGTMGNSPSTVVR